MPSEQDAGRHRGRAVFRGLWGLRSGVGWGFGVNLGGLPGAPQHEAGLTRKFETSHVGGATGRTPPIPRSALEKDPMEGCNRAASLISCSCRAELHSG